MKTIGSITDLFISVEGLETICDYWESYKDDYSNDTKVRLLGADSIDEIFGVKIHTVDKLGEEQEYQRYYLNELGGSIPTNKYDIIVGLSIMSRHNDNTDYTDQNNVLLGVI